MSNKTNKLTAADAAARCPCYAQLPSPTQPNGTGCLNVPTAGQSLCSYHLELFDAIDRRACQGISGDMALGDSLPSLDD